MGPLLVGDARRDRRARHRAEGRRDRVFRRGYRQDPESTAALSSGSLEHQVERALVALVTHLFPELGAIVLDALEAKRHRPRPRKDVRVRDDGFILDRIGVDGREALRDVQSIAVKIPHDVEPSLVYTRRVIASSSTTSDAPVTQDATTNNP